MAESLLTALFGTKSDRDLRELVPVVQRINALEPALLALDDAEFPRRTDGLRSRLAGGAKLDDLLPEAYALAREAARRRLGERLFDVQLMGSVVLHRGRIVEMKTGEGKTLASVPAAYLNALAGRGVHIVTVNDYLAERDAAWMGPVYRLLGVSVGVILGQMDNARRKESYAKDITYGTNNEFGFDYLRDNMCFSPAEKVQRGHAYAIVDEIDNILIDEARTPLIISGSAEDDTLRYFEANRIVPGLVECAKDPTTDEYPEEPEGDYKIDEKGKRVTFTDQGMNHIEELLVGARIITGSLFTDGNFEHLHYVTQSLRAHKLFHKDVDYVVQDGQVQIVDEFTGRILHGRRYSEGLHQAIEAKERIKIAQRNRTLATITFQNYFRMYGKLAGMTGTADTEAQEFGRIYALEVVVIPTNRPVVRTDNDDVIYLTEDDKLAAICDEIAELNAKGQPVLVGTISIEKSERLSRMLVGRGIRHEVLNAKNHAREALIIAEAGAKGSVTIATNMAGRGTDIKLGGNPEFRARRRAGSAASEEDYRAALTLEYPAWQEHYAEVKSLGGLHVLGTERHEARRIDNQLRGRSGRQGDPGSSRFYISLEDDLMRLFGGENIKGLMSRMGMKPGEPIVHPWLNKSIERAQKKVEERNFEIRKHLLEYDDVLNEQRKFIYAARDEIIADSDLKERLLATADDIADELFTAYRQTVVKGRGSLPGLLSGLKEQLWFEPDDPPEVLAALDPEKLEEAIKAGLRRNLQTKADQAGREVLNRYIMFNYLRNIDARWQDHLENLEALREAVYLRAYSQKNPLLEYKLEGFQIFDEMLMGIKTAIARTVFRVRIEREPARAAAAPRAVPVQAVHGSFGQFGAAGSTASTAVTAGPAPAAVRPVTVQRSVPKVGRNDPCPCGSGKKYKYCHGA
ncbi:MAG: preprotein translocase subunit SecA [Spirochaetes bacterium RBG_13_68_11]|nr:MAG: preprotein translocase subunit SecA [Spirochaetes bacterium RBG_13_68_11]